MSQKWYNVLVEWNVYSVVCYNELEVFQLDWNFPNNCQFYWNFCGTFFINYTNFYKVLQDIRRNRWGNVLRPMPSWITELALRIQLSVLVYNKEDIISSKWDLFSPWYSWKIAYFALSNQSVPKTTNPHLV
jgi:hypothetical protein